MMGVRDVVAELIGAAHQEWAGISILETTRFEPELAASVPRAIAAAKRRCEALVTAARTLDPKVDCSQLPGAAS